MTPRYRPKWTPLRTSRASQCQQTASNKAAVAVVVVVATLQTSPVLMKSTKNVII